MIIERPPLLYRWLLPHTIWRLPKLNLQGRKAAYLTFDDGPIPEVTPWVLSVLAEKGVKGTFFSVADNALRYPGLFQQILDEGHAVGNHTFHHLQGLHTSTDSYMKDVALADKVIRSRLFRPPHGLLKRSQLQALWAAGYRIIMQDLVTRDYSKWVSPEKTLWNVIKYVRDGSIIVFHDSIKAEAKLRYALPRAIDYLLSEGYDLELLPGGRRERISSDEMSSTLNAI